jgi:four helix bundle protein
MTHSSDAAHRFLPRFEHEKLDVYGLALEFVSFSQTLVQTIPRGNSALTDQLTRAAASIVLNTAEGCGEFSRKEKARFYRMALRSTGECAAVLDVALRLNVISRTQATTGKESLGRILGMLTALVRSHDRP